MRYRTRTYDTDAQKALMWSGGSKAGAAPDCSPVQSSPHVGPGDLVPHGRHSATRSSSLRHDTDAGRKRGEISGTMEPKVSRSA